MEEEICIIQTPEVDLDEDDGYLRGREECPMQRSLKRWLPSPDVLGRDTSGFSTLEESSSIALLRAAQGLIDTI
jgi:hypothetical protein